MRPTRLLVATRHSPLPETDGAAAYLFDLLRYFSEHGFRIEVAWLHADGAIAHTGHWRVPDRFSQVARLQVIGGHAVGHRIIFPSARWLPFKARRLHEARLTLHYLGLDSLLRRRTRPAPTFPASYGALGSAHWSALPTPDEIDFFNHRLRAFRPDVVLVNYCWLTPLVEGLTLPTAVLTNDVVSQRVAPTPGISPDPGTPQGEAELLRTCRHVLAISEEDALIFRRHLPGHSILHTPKAADPRPFARATDPSRVLFVGGSNSFNADGLQWFLKNAWPLVQRGNPKARLRICGGICGSVPKPPPGVECMGRVPDLTEEYRAAAVVIVPLLAGSGIKIKLVEAVSRGKAVVTTPIGLQGLSFLRPAVREAVDAETFAAAVVELLNDGALQASLGATALSLVNQNLSRDRAYGSTCDALRTSAK